MDKSKGIEIVKQNSNAVSVNVGGKQVSLEGKAIALHFDEQPAYVYLVIDCSRSMAGYKLAETKKGALAFAADAFKNGYKIGLISFDTTATHISEPVQDAASLSAAVGRLKIGGSTNMTEALVMAHRRFKTLGGTRVIVIATDGQPDKPGETLRAAKAVKNDGIDIIAIGTAAADQRFLEKLASRKELSSKVKAESFATAITSASSLLPPPRGIIRR